MASRSRIVANLKKDDAAINKWCDSQESISKSIRYLVLAAIKKDGYKDYVEHLLEQQLCMEQETTGVVSHPQVNEPLVLSEDENSPNAVGKDEMGSKMKNIFDGRNYDNL